MKDDASIRRSDVRVIAVLCVILAGLVGLITITFDDPSLDASHIMPIRSARAATLVPAPKAVPAALPTLRKSDTVTPEENWAADDASHGLRPDAAH